MSARPARAEAAAPPPRRSQATRAATPRPAPAAPAGSRADGVYAQLLLAVNDGRFRPGDRVLEAEVATWLKVSRTPVREALRRLESEDVLVRGTQGLTVAAIGDDEVLELYEMREALEGMAAECAARRATARDRAALQRILEREGQLSDADLLAMAALNREFHVALAAASHNRYLGKALNAMQDAFLRLRSTTFSMRGRPRQALEEHRRIVEAILAQDAAAAARHARAHIRASRRLRIRLNDKVRAATQSEGLGKPPRAWR